MSAFLQPFAGAKPVREAWNIVDLSARLAGRNKQTSRFYTREDLKHLGIEWIYGGTRAGTPRRTTAGERGGIGRGRNGAAAMGRLVPLDNTDRAASENQSRYCPIVYVWMR